MPFLLKIIILLNALFPLYHPVEFLSFVLCLRRQLYLEIKEQVHEIDERSKEQVKKKEKKCFLFIFFFLFLCLFYFAFVVFVFWGAGGGGRFRKIQSNFFLIHCKLHYSDGQSLNTHAFEPANHKQKALCASAESAGKRM